MLNSKTQVKHRVRNFSNSKPSTTQVKHRVRNFSKSKPSKTQSAGALYTFDLNDSVGGLPNIVTLNNTNDGDCQQLSANELGMSNYSASKGGSRKKKSKSMHKSYKSSNSRKTKKYRKSGKTRNVRKYRTSGKTRNASKSHK